MKNFEKFVIETQQNPYPPYHKGKYLEQYFIDYYFKHKNEFKNSNHEFIPVCWTDIYLHRADLINDLQLELDKLDQSRKYFTVSQHDDAPFQKLPPNTKNYSAGGNQPNITPIPLICSPIPNIPDCTKKDVFCSFVGSITQPIQGWGKISYDIRMNMLETLVNDTKYTLKPKHWSPKINEERKDLFLDLTSRSKFTLCPRGYGATSFRLYEAMQMKSIPVYIFYKKPHLPFSNKIDWNKIAILIDYDNINQINNILTNISDEKYQEMVNYTSEIYSDYFSLEGASKQILESLK
jgi:hypothetical protein